MLEGLKKFGRAFRRDYFTKSAQVTCGVVAVGAALALVAGYAALPVILAGVLLEGAAIASFAAYAEVKMRQRKHVDLGMRIHDGIGLFLNLSGPGKNISIIANTQKLLDSLMYKHRNTQNLPPDALKKFAPYLKDAEEAAKEVRVVMPGTPVELPKFQFLREYFQAAGKPPERLAVADVSVPHTPTPLEIDQLVEDMTNGAGEIKVMRTLRLKPRANLFQSLG